MKDILINDNLLEVIRTSINTSKWHDNNAERIVDFGYTHEYLLSKRNVDDIIKEFYIKSLKEIYSNDEWQELKNLDKQNKSFITNQCSFLIEGALHNRVNFYLKIGAFLELKDKHSLNDNLKYISDLKPYFKRYAGDFKRGYNQFLNVIVKPYSLFDSDKEEAAEIIFRYITNDQLNDPVTTLMKEFKINFENGDYEIDYDFSEGLIEGYIYRAWTIIFSQNELFLPLFKKYLNIRNLKNKSNAQAVLTMNQIALKHYYEKAFITRENSDNIAKQFGHNSGEKLYQKFTFYSSRANRKGIPTNCTQRKLKNKISLLESVIKILPKQFKQQAIDEVNILKSIAKTQEY